MSFGGKNINRGKIKKKRGKYEGKGDRHKIKWKIKVNGYNK
jgi:hypothetical protein